MPNPVTVTMEPVRLYADRSLAAPDLSHIPLLYPFWGVIFKESNPYVSVAYEKYGFSKEGFEIVSKPENADYVLIPNPYWPFVEKYPERVEKIIEIARAHNKPLLIDGSGDIEKPIDVPNSVILRISQYRFQARDNEIAIPLPAEDLLETSLGGVLPIRHKAGKPVVAFSGWAALSTKQLWKMRLKGLRFFVLSFFDPRYGAYEKGVLLRRRIVRMLSSATRIVPKFIVRGSYSAHVKTIQGNFTDNRAEFLNNLKNADYALSVRGDANADSRLYEALSLGRIPLLIDTERVLPLADELNYSDFCLVVDFRKIDQLENIVADFHEQLTDEQFVAMQHKAREAFEKYLRYNAFTPRLAALLRKRLATSYTPRT